MTQTHPNYSAQYPVQSQSTRPEATPPAEMFGTVFFEVVLNSAASPAMTGWTLRLWPQARLGDATLEATPTDGARSESDLLTGLRAQGIEALGPVRRHT